MVLVDKLTSASSQDHVRTVCFAIGKYQTPLSHLCLRRLEAITEGVKICSGTTKLLYALILSKIVEKGDSKSVSTGLEVLKQTDDPSIISTLKQGLSCSFKVTSITSLKEVETFALELLESLDKAEGKALRLNCLLLRRSLGTTGSHLPKVASKLGAAFASKASAEALIVLLNFL